MADYRKVTTGFVIQTFNKLGQCIAQEFICGDQVDNEDEYGNPLPSKVYMKFEYQPYDMVQPKPKKKPKRSEPLEDPRIQLLVDDAGRMGSLTLHLLNVPENRSFIDVLKASKRFKVRVMGRDSDRRALFAEVGKQYAEYGHNDIQYDTPEGERCEKYVVYLSNNK